MVEMRTEAEAPVTHIQFERIKVFSDHLFLGRFWLAVFLVMIVEYL
jgi:hypothetical protein